METMMIGLWSMLSIAGAADLVNAETEDGFGFTVALGADIGGQTFSACTGSLITPQVVLTAAHCGSDLPMELVVSLGKAFFGPRIDAADTVGFAEGIFHPDYVELQNGIGGTLGQNDIALLVLEEPVDWVEPIWIAEDSIADLAVGASVTSIGFGVSSSAGTGSGIKRSAELTVDRIDDTFVYSNSATNDNSANVCSGDSGGPQVYWDGERWVQWAVHSWADQSCLAQSGSTRVDTISPWIMDQLESVHGTRDRCEMWGLYGDGICDADCDAEDVDCATPVEADSSEKSSGVGCATAPPALAVWWVALLGLAGRRRRRGTT